MKCYGEIRGRGVPRGEKKRTEGKANAWRHR